MENLPENAWKRLRRRAKHDVKTMPRARPANVKEQIVKQREFENIRLVKEYVAEFEYSPTRGKGCSFDCLTSCLFRYVVSTRHAKKKPESGCSGPPPRPAPKVLPHATATISTSTSQPTRSGGLAMRPETTQQFPRKRKLHTLV